VGVGGHGGRAVTLPAPRAVPPPILPLVVGLLTPVPALAQALASARMDVHVREEAGVAVRLTSRLTLVDGVASVPLSLVLPEGVDVVGLEARVDGAPAAVRWASGGRVRRGEVALGGRGSEATLELRYEVAGGEHRRDREASVTVPLPAVTWPPAEARPGTFSARVRLPPGLVLREGFPTSWERVSSDTTGDVYAVELPVLPAFLRIGAGAPGVNRLTLPGVLGGVALALLALMAFPAFRHLAKAAR